MKIFGVNYGNRFIPEEWMQCDSLFDGVQSRGCEPGAKEPRLCLADLEDEFERRYLDWLDRTIQESDFRAMAESGVNVVRVPCGYWNWISLPDGQTPNGEHADRMRVLQSVRPDRYLQYFDRIFDHAQNNGLRVLLDLHGLPGSQNGEMHSGISQRQPNFNTDCNRTLAVQAVAAMASYCARKRDALYGLQVINEPNNYGSDFLGFQGRFLDRFYREAIAAARQALPPEVPIVVFAWVRDFGTWRDDHFPAAEYGTVLWDTHIYSVRPHASVQAAKHAYWGELQELEQFHRRQPGGIVGEWSLAGPSFGAGPNQELAAWLVWCFMERCHGCFFWNWEAPIAEWSFKGAAQRFGIDWKTIPKPS